MLKKRPDAMIYAVALGALVVIGMITTAIIDRVKGAQSTGDVRAKAGVTSTLTLIGTIEVADELAGVITVSNVQFDEESRSGKPVNYGTWTVTPPASVRFSTLVPGKTIQFTISSDSFNVATKNVTAASVTVGK